MRAPRQYSTVRIGVALLVLTAAASPLLGGAVEVLASCEPHPPATDLLEAVAIVDGAIVGERPGDRGRPIWTFRVDERFRGAIPDVIEIEWTGSTEWSHPPPDGVLAFYVETAPHRYEWTTECRYQEVDRELLERTFSAPEVSSGGAPHAIVAIDSRDHSLAVVDADGNTVALLPAPGPTVGLGTCPGGDRFVQLRAAAGQGEPLPGVAELAIWSIASMSVESAVPVDYPVSAGVAAVSCLTDDASRVAISNWIGAIEIVGGVAAAMTGLATDDPVDPPATADGQRALEQVVVDDGAGARLALTLDGEAFVETPTASGVLEVFLEYPGGGGRNWHPAGVSSIQPRPDGGWWLTMDDGDRASVVLIRPDATSLDTGRSVRTDVTAWWPVGMLFDPTIDVEVPASSSAPPIPLLERNGERIESSLTSSPTAASASDAATTDGPSDGPSTTEPAGGSDGSGVPPDAPDDERASGVWIVSGFVLFAAVGFWAFASRRRRSG